MVNRKQSRYSNGDEKLKAMREAAHPDGVSVDPVPVTAGEEVTVLYYGPLARPDQKEVWLHIGYGSANNWEKVTDLRMERTGRGWARTFSVGDGDRLNFCFRDEQGNWDNNGGLNWSLEVHQGRI